jgi:hypothetical protein
MSLSLLLLLAAFPEPEKPAPRLEELAPHACGVCLAEVVSVQERDARPADGDFTEEVTLKILRGSGEVRSQLPVIKEHGGLRPTAPPPIQGPLRAGGLKKGQRYWIAFASSLDHEKYTNGVVGYWPEDKADVAKVLDEAIKEDRFRWRPEYDPKTGLAYGYLATPGKKSWQVRIEKQGKVLWEKEVPGERSERGVFWGLSEGGYNSFPSQKPRSGKLFWAESAQRLDKDNEYGVAEGMYYVTTGWDPETGKRIAAWLALHKGPHVDVLHREYNADGKPRREERFDWLPSGGKAVGAAEESWYRKIARTFDPDTGKVAKEETFRYDSAQEVGQRWVKVQPGK